MRRQWWWTYFLAAMLLGAGIWSSQGFVTALIAVVVVLVVGAEFLL